MKSREGEKAKLLYQDLTERIIRCALEVHTVLGPGLLESVYEEALTMEFALDGLAFVRQIEMPVDYKGSRLNGTFRADMVVEDAVVLELKSAMQMNPIFEAQLLTYMRLGGWKIGLILNFGQANLKDGLKRVVL
jgi:GxxExxY protein